MYLEDLLHEIIVERLVIEAKPGLGFGGHIMDMCWDELNNLSFTEREAEDLIREIEDYDFDEIKGFAIEIMEGEEPKNFEELLIEGLKGYFMFVNGFGVAMYSLQEIGLTVDDDDDVVEMN